LTSTIKYFDIQNFEAQWADSPPARQAVMVDQAENLSPDEGILPALEGYACANQTLKARAIPALQALSQKTASLSAPKENGSLPQEGMAVSARVCTRIYGKLAGMEDEREKSFLIRLLAGMDGMGPGSAFMALAAGHLSAKSMEGMIPVLSEPERLCLTAHYIHSNPDIRLTLAPLFKRILASVNKRSHVIDFFAQLFDSGRDTDPFLHNIKPALRDSKSILAKEMASIDLNIKIRGLKALSMVANRIPVSILEGCLNQETGPRLRKVVYRIIRNAAPGTYADLFDSIYTLLDRMGEAETQTAVKALAASGKHPMHEFLNIIQTQHPHLVPQIMKETQNLSKTGFLFLQDLALSPGHYRSGIHREINIACIFGMVKKRPERVARLLKKMVPRRPELKTKRVNAFLSHTQDLLDKEKKDITSVFRPQPSDRAPTIRERDFSNRKLTGKDHVFKGTLFHQCRFFNSTLSALSFNSTSLVHADFTEAQFDTVTFDNSLWINVTARKAVFKNCRFLSARICNTDFQEATFIDCFFTEAIITGTDFNRADLLFSSFCQATLSSVFLNNTRGCHLDFSGVRARFSRFPSPDQMALRTGEIDYNARKFQPATQNIPALDEPVIQRINLMIFCEFTRYGQEKFLRQNRMSLLTALDIFAPKSRDLFRIIPALLHTNASFSLTEDVPEDTPCGIADYTPQIQTLSLITSYTNEASWVCRPPSSPAILGLFTIGSVGSVAQTKDSDIDYWVCIREAELMPGHRRLLENKLTHLEKMAIAHFHTQVTFFIVDIDRVRANDFGDSTMESSGSAQAGILKEEFYRTMIYIAGKLPLWAVLPTSVSHRYYAAVAKRLSLPGHQCRYLDLGDIHDISYGEYFGASVWQMFKWIKSPFKSILKMALLEKYFSQSSKSLLLCNQYKIEWMNTGSRLRLAQNDSYYFLVKHLVRFYEAQKDAHSVNLLLTCFFLKLGIPDTEALEQTPFGMRRVLLLKCLSTWGWEMKKAREVGRIDTWPYKNILRLSRALEAYIIEKYNRVTEAGRDKGILETMISPEDRTILEHKVKIEFSREPMKVQKVLLVSRGDSHFSRLYLKCIKPTPPSGSWALINQSRNQADELIFRADTIEEIGAFLVVNGLFSARTRIRLPSSPFPLTEDGVNSLFKSLLDFFSPRLEKPVPFKQLLAYPEKKAVFASINFYARENDRTLTHYTALYINGWNEIFCRSGYAPKGFISIAHVKRELAFNLRMTRLPDQTVFFSRFHRPVK